MKLRQKKNPDKFRIPSTSAERETGFENYRVKKHDKLRRKKPCLPLSSRNVFNSFKKGVIFMSKKVQQSRLSLYIPTVLYDRIDSDSTKYGITKTALLSTMIVNYYRSIDDASLSPAGDSLPCVKGQAGCHASSDTP